MSPSCKGQQCRMFPACRHNEDDSAKQTALETNFQKSFVLFASWLSASSKFKQFEQTHIHCFTPCCTCIQQKEKGVKIQLLPWQHLTTGVRRVVFATAAFLALLGHLGNDKGRASEPHSFIPSLGWGWTSLGLRWDFVVAGGVWVSRVGRPEDPMFHLISYLISIV